MDLQSKEVSSTLRVQLVNSDTIMRSISAVMSFQRKMDQVLVVEEGSR